MENRRWMTFRDKGAEGSVPRVSVRRVAQAPGIRAGAGAVSVRYSVDGAWRGTLADATAVEVPGAAHIDAEGAPQVPTAGLLVALPPGAENVTVKVASKQTALISLDAQLVAAPKQFREREYLPVFEPDPAIYGQAGVYPGRDVDLIAVREIEGIRVAQLLVYLGQYEPSQRRLELITELELEVGYTTVPGAGYAGLAASRTATRLIHGLDLFAVPQEPARKPAAAAETPRASVPLSPAAQGKMAEPRTGGTDAPVLRSTSNYAPFVVVTTPALAGSVAPLLQVNSPARTALTSDIAAEFGAVSLEQSIHDFVGWAYANWSPVKPQFLVLAGDTDVIPMHLYQRSDSYASDNYYVDQTGDLCPEIVVSRIPVSDAATMAAVCQRIAGYRQLRIAGGRWTNRVLVAAYQDTVYETCADALATSLGSIYEVTKRYAKDTDRAALLASLNGGVCMGFYRGHGSKTEWSSSNGLRASDVPGLTTESCPPFMLEICCENGWVDDRSVETLAEALIRQGKALSVLAASRDSWTYPNNDFARYLVDAILRAGLTRPGDIVKYAKTRMIVDHPNSAEYADDLLMYNLFGDPMANVAGSADHLLGAYAMDHDGWQGLLRIGSVSGFAVVQGSGTSAPVWQLAGTYTGADGKVVGVSGTAGGIDPNYEGGAPRRSDNRLDLTVRFPTPQRFVGYLHSRSRNEMSGHTWWAQIPFGWTARRLGTVLTSPTATAPADGAVFSTYPRTTTLTWSEVPNADQYVVEVEYGYGGGWYPELLTVTSTPTITFSHVGAQPGRWRVSARDSRGGRYGQSGPTPWQTFRYTV